MGHCRLRWAVSKVEVYVEFTLLLSWSIVVPYALGLSYCLGGNVLSAPRVEVHP